MPLIVVQIIYGAYKYEEKKIISKKKYFESNLEAFESGASGANYIWCMPLPCCTAHILTNVEVVMIVMIITIITVILIVVMMMMKIFLMPVVVSSSCQ